jgi:hypothetical protein
MRPAFRRGWEGEGKPNRRPGAGQRARSDRHTGAAILLWEREGKALGVPTQSNGTEAAASPSRSAAQERRPCTARRRRAVWRRAERATRPLRAAQRRQSQRARDRRPTGKERGKSASGSAQKRRALRSAQRGTERVPKPSRSFYGRPYPLPLPIVTRMGRDYRPGSRSE